jgi:hypothetical protein
VNSPLRDLWWLWSIRPGGLPLSRLVRAQRLNGTVVLYRIGQRARRGSWSLLDTRRTCRMAIACCMTESSLWIYANTRVPESLEHYHELVGEDHRSVGLFQQQTPMWGSAAECMDPIASTDLFVDVCLDMGLTRVSSGVPGWEAIQQVQRSAFADGSNYRRQWRPAKRFVAAHAPSWLP